MHIQSTIVCPGPNIRSLWPMIRLIVDFGFLGTKTASDLGEAFIGGLLRHLPGLERHALGNEKQGQFVERMAQPGSVSIPEVAWRVALELQIQVGAKVGLGGAYPGNHPGSHEIAYTYEDVEVGKRAGVLALGLIHHLLPDELKPGLRSPTAFDFTAEPKPLREIAQRRSMDINTVYLLQAAQRRNIPWLRLDSKICQLGQGKYRRHVRSAATGLQPLIGFKMTEDKAITVSVLGRLGLPVPQQVVARSARAALDAAARIGYPVVVKPLSSYTGLGVSTRLTDPEQITGAFDSARKHSSNVIVETFIEGNDHRLLVVGGSMVAAVRRVPAHVVGDGQRTVRQLVEAINRQRRARGRKPKYDMKIDEVAEWHLRRAGCSAESVPDSGTKVFLRSASNYSQGGYAIDVTDEVHPDNRMLAVRASKAFDLDVAGVDFITTDISRSYLETGGAICEVGTRPGLLLHMSPDIGEARDVASPIINLLYPPGMPARIPVVAITGNRFKQSTGRMLAHFLTLGGHAVGHASREQICVGGTTFLAKGKTSSNPAAALFGNPEVNAAILEISLQQLDTVGLGCDGSDVGVLTHAGQLPESGTFAEKIAVIAGSARLGLVINADDKLCARLAAELPAASICLATLLEKNDVVAKHIESGGRAVRLEATSAGGALVFHHQRQTVWSLPLSAIPLAKQDGSRPALPQPALLAAGAAWLTGLPLPWLGDGLATLSAPVAEEMTSLRVFRGAGFPILLADMERPGAAALALDISARLAPDGGRAAIVAGLPASGEMAQFAHFERLWCVEENTTAQRFQDMGNAAAQPVQSLCRALRQAGAPEQGLFVCDSLGQALAAARDSVGDHGILTIFARDMTHSRGVLENLFPPRPAPGAKPAFPPLPRVSTAASAKGATAPLPLWTGGELAAAVRGTWISGAGEEVAAQGVTYFLWETKPGDVVLATNPDQWAHKYANLHQSIPELFQKGAAAVIVSELPPGLPPHYPLLKVENTWAALNDLGQAARERLVDAGVIAVTGSVGKTTTTETIFHLLGQQAPTFATHKNYNSTPGVPVTLARTPRDVRYAVYEFGIGRSHPANIRRAKMIRPHVAVITAIEPDHLAFYGTLEEIVEAKTKLFDGLEPGGTAILNSDSNLFELQLAMARQKGVARIVTFGTREDADVRLVEAALTATSGSALARVHGEEIRFTIPQPGRHMLMNGLAALAAVEAIGADWRQAALDLGTLPPVPGRAQFSRVKLGNGEFTLIDDAYSANTGSIRSAITLLDLTEPAPGGHRFAILGEMKELGPTSPLIHASLAPAVIASRVDRVFTLGGDMAYLRDALPAKIQGSHGDNAVEMAHAILDQLRDGDVVLVKGSARTPGAMKQLLAILREGRPTTAAPLPASAEPAALTTARPLPADFELESAAEQRIVFLGDTSFGENYQTDIQRRGGLNILDAHGYDYGFAQVDGILKSAGLVIANLETPVTDLKESPLSGKKKWLHWTDVKEAPPALLRHNIRVASLANNHTFDYGPAGFEQTLAVLKANRLHCLGAGDDLSDASRPLVVKADCKGAPFEMAVISAYQFSVLGRDVFGMFAAEGKSGVNPLTVPQLASRIRELKLRSPGVFVVPFLHWGNNYAWRSDYQAEVADDLIAAGADLIIGHGAHMIQEIEKRQGRWVIYSIGNFIFNSPGRYQKCNAPPYSFVAELRASGARLALRLYPIVTDNTVTGYQPRTVTGEEFRQLLSTLAERPCAAIGQDGMRSGEKEGRHYLELSIR